MTLLPPRSGSLAEFAQQVEAAPIHDVSHLGMEVVGADLDPDFQPPPPLELDLSGLGLEPPGADLEPDYQPPPPLQVINNKGTPPTRPKSSGPPAGT